MERLESVRKGRRRRRGSKSMFHAWRRIRPLAESFTRALKRWVQSDCSNLETASFGLGDAGDLPLAVLLLEQVLVLDTGFAGVLDTDGDHGFVTGIEGKTEGRGLR